MLDFVRDVLPYLESYDLMGTGPIPQQWEKDEINNLMRIGYDMLKTPDDERAFH